jgi:hypothetical protein
MNLQDLAWIMPLATVLIAALRPRRGDLTAIARVVRDLITLRLVLHRTTPAERVILLDAHRQWRAEPPAEPDAPNELPPPSAPDDP